MPYWTKKKLFSGLEIVEDIQKNGSEDEGDSSGLDSGDSLFEDALDHGIDPVADRDVCPFSPPAVARKHAFMSPSRRALFSMSSSSPSSKGAKTPPNPRSRRAALKRKGRWSPHTPSPSGKAKKRAPSPSTPPAGEEERWKDIAEPDTAPSKYPFCPARTTGVQLDIQKPYTPLELFRLFFSSSAVKTICTNTNKNASRRLAQGIKTPWVPLTETEFYHYVGLLISMALLKAHQLSDYWSQYPIYRLPFFKSVMPRMRFEAISLTLHMSDPAQDAHNDQKKGTPEFDPLFRIRSLMDRIKEACRAFYHPHQCLSIDEQIVPSKVRIGMRQYIKAKPTKWGFKLFVLADSRNGYMCDFNIYTRKSYTATGKGLSYDAVMDLLSGLHLGTGYHVYMDDFYTSDTLFKDLHQMKFGACGTARENRQGFPRCLENNMPKRAPRGTIRWLRRGPLLYVKWMDMHEVNMCSTIHQAYNENIMKRRIHDPQNTWILRTVPVPDSVLDYNKFMGGVDRSDALLGCYSVHHKTSKWYKALFFHFIDIAIVNAYLLHKEMAAMRNGIALSQKQFREILSVELVKFTPGGASGQAADTGQSANADPEPPRASAPLESDEPEETGPIDMHLVEPIIDPSTVSPSLKATIGRKNCVNCLASKKYSKTIWKCVKCNVPLCVIPDRNCFKQWHQNTFNSLCHVVSHGQEAARVQKVARVQKAARVQRAAQSQKATRGPKATQKATQKETQVQNETQKETQKETQVQKEIKKQTQDQNTSTTLLKWLVKEETNEIVIQSYETDGDV